MNIFDLTGTENIEGEFFEEIISSENIKIERIISRGHTTPEGEWYDQTLDEWVLLVQGRAEITFSDGEIIILTSGDSVFLPARKKHRVTFTSSEPPCVWLAVHAALIK